MTCETYVYSIALLLFHIWVGTKHCCCESLCLFTKLCGVGCRFAIAEHYAHATTYVCLLLAEDAYASVIFFECIHEVVGQRIVCLCG